LSFAIKLLKTFIEQLSEGFKDYEEILKAQIPRLVVFKKGMLYTHDMGRSFSIKSSVL